MAALHKRRSLELEHLGFAAASRDAVVKLCEELRTAAVMVLDAPADYPRYSPDCFAVFFADPDGSKLEYVFTDERVN